MSHGNAIPSKVEHSGLLSCDGFKAGTEDLHQGDVTAESFFHSPQDFAWNLFSTKLLTTFVMQICSRVWLLSSKIKRQNATKIH